MDFIIKYNIVTFPSQIVLIYAQSDANPFLNSTAEWLEIFFSFFLGVCHICTFAL